MEFLSLNDIYKFKAMHYWCNAAGDINIPGDPSPESGLFATHSADDLPQKARTLYETYWTECGYVPEYVVQLNGRTGFAFCFLLDDDYAETLEISVHELRKIAHALAEDVFSKPLYENCTFIYGEETDPVGDEFMIFVPYENMEDIKAIHKDLWDTTFYASINRFVKIMHSLEQD